MFLVLLLLTLCLHAVDCPWWLTRPGVVTCGGAATRPRTLAPCRTHPVLVAVVKVAVVKAAVPAPAPPPPLGRPQDLDPRPGMRVSIHPQPTRAPRNEAMALGPLRGRGAARAVARGPTQQWSGGGLTGGSAAAALRLPLAPGAAGMVAGGLPALYPPPRGERRGLGGSQGTGAA